MGWFNEGKFEMVLRNMPALKKRYLKKCGFLSAISVLLLGQALVAANPAIASTAHDPLYIEPRTEHRCPPSAQGNFNTAILNSIVGSTPQEEQAGCRGHYDPAMFTFDVDESGNFSHLKVVFVSGLFDRDFWTLYAIASCPPMKPLPGLTPPVHANVGNMCSRIVSTIQGEENRLSLLRAIPRKPDSQTISFTLIPASVIGLVPGTFTIGDICQRQNVVAIPANCLQSNGKNYWTVDEANELVNGHCLISDFLREWPQFYKDKPHPSKEDIVSFADALKIKYKSLLLEGVP